MSIDYIDAEWLASATLDELLQEAKALRFEIDTINDQLGAARADPDNHDLSWFIKAQGASRIKFLQVQAIDKKIEWHKREHKTALSMAEKAEAERLHHCRMDENNRRKIEFEQRKERLIINHLEKCLGRENFKEMISPIMDELKSISEELRSGLQKEPTK